MKYLTILFLTLVLSFTSCKKEEPLTEPEFELLSKRISGTSDASFQLGLQSVYSVFMMDVIQKPNGDYLLLGTFSSRIREVNNVMFVANFQSNGELDWTRKLNTTHTYSSSRFGSLNLGRINIIAKSNTDITSQGYMPKPALLKLDEEGSVLIEKVYGLRNVNHDVGELNSSDEKLLLVGGDYKGANDLMSIIDVNSGQSDLQKTFTGLIFSATYLDNSDILVAVINYQSNQNAVWELQKVNSNGDSLWSISNSLNNTGNCRSILATEAGGFFAAFDPSSNTGQFRITKYDSNGIPLWNHNSNTTIPQYQYTAHKAGADYFYVGQTTQGIQVNKLSEATGELIWTKTIPLTAGAFITKISATNDGGLVLLFSSAGSTMNFLQKLDSNGN